MSLESCRKESQLGLTSPLRSHSSEQVLWARSTVKWYKCWLCSPSTAKHWAFPNYKAFCFSRCRRTVMPLGFRDHAFRLTPCLQFRFRTLELAWRKSRCQQCECASSPSGSGHLWHGHQPARSIPAPPGSTGHRSGPTAALSWGHLSITVHPVPINNILHFFKTSPVFYTFTWSSFL